MALARWWQDLAQRRRRSCPTEPPSSGRPADSRLRVILDALPFEVLVATSDGRVLLNDAARLATGIDRLHTTVDRLAAMLEGALTISRTRGGPALPLDELPLERALRGHSVDAELHVVSRPTPSVPTLQPRQRIIQVHSRPVVTGDTITGAVMTIEDADAVHQDNDRLRRRNEQLTAVARAVRAILRGQDGRTAIVEAATAICGARGVTLFEPDAEDLVCTASTGADLVGLRVPLGRSSVLAEAYDTGRRIFLDDTYADPRLDADLHEQISAQFGTPITCACWIPVVDSGRCHGVLIASFAEPVDIREVEAALGLLADEAALALAHERLVLELERLSGSDPLTGAVNRRSWDEQLTRELPRAARDGRPVSVLMLDVDRFKAYNDRNGHAAGDVLLREAVRAWAERLRPTDVLCRWGGDEFAVLLPGCELAHAAAIAEELRAMVLANTSCSVGVAQWDGAEPATALLQRADAELYRAKSAGRDQVSVAARS